MKLGRIIGRVVLSKKDESLAGGSLLVVSPLGKSQIADLEDLSLSQSQPNLVVYDKLGARAGDVISYVEGAEATAPFEFPIPIDAYNVGIVDSVNYRPNS